MRPYIIAECGVNHDGSPRRAEELIHLAAQSGADAVKFQAYKADKLAAKNSPTYFHQEGEAAASQREFFARYDSLGPKDYRHLASVAQKDGIEFICTPFDEEAVAFLHPLVKQFKIASADITNWPLIHAIAACEKPVLLSTGAATWDEIDRAVRWLYEAQVPNLTLLHCVLSYPTTPADANLGLIRKLGARFPDCGLGYSDHTLGMDACYDAFLLGATLLEKHFTDDADREGNDHYHSMGPGDLRLLRDRLDGAAKRIGDGDRGQPLPVELPARQQARRALYAVRRFPAGHILQIGDLIPKRPAAGLEPFWLPQIVGRELAKAMEEEEAVTWTHLA